MTLFEHEAQSLMERQAPLATRMRPRTFDELVGQEHLVGPGRALRRSIEADRIPSMVLWGPPGSGKTTLARLIASVSRGHFSPVSAVGSGVAELRSVVKEARGRLGMHRQRTILFIDEIHRFNKAQQDVILPHVENGTVILIGATTENPSFEVNSPLLSRSRVYRLNALTEEQLADLLVRAASDPEHGLGEMRVDVEPEALRALAALSGGDARIALNALELAAGATEPSEDGRRRVAVATVEDAMQQRSLLYDRAGDQHYDTISAFIKSLRGSDPNAAIYWLARMIEAGEDPLFISAAPGGPCRGGRRAGGPAGVAGCGGRAAGRPLLGHAGGAHTPCRGDGLPGHGAQEQRGLRRHRRCPGGRARHRQRSGADASAQRSDRADARHGLR